VLLVNSLLHNNGQYKNYTIIAVVLLVNSLLHNNGQYKNYTIIAVVLLVNSLLHNNGQYKNSHPWYITIVCFVYPVEFIDKLHFTPIVVYSVEFVHFCLPLYI